MTFVKPSIKYTDMAIWIDNNSRLPTCDENVLYRYLYHLVNMIAHQSSLFKKLDDYDQFSLYCASRLVLRIRHSDLTDESTHIKSILNYLKMIVPLWRGDYEREFHIMSDEYDIIPLGSYDLGDHMTDIISYHDVSAYAFTCDDVVDVIQHHLSKIPKKRKSPEWTNIYISCVLTLLDRLEYSIETALSRQTGDRYEIVNKSFHDAKKRPPILFHIDESKSNYVEVLVVEIQHAIAAELSYEMGRKVSAANSMKSLIYSALTDNEDN